MESDRGIGEVEGSSCTGLFVLGTSSGGSHSPDFGLSRAASSPLLDQVGWLVGGAARRRGGHSLSLDCQVWKLSWGRPESAILTSAADHLNAMFGFGPDT
jgi:hypothetical protein